MTYRTAAMSLNQGRASFSKNKNTVSYDSFYGKLGPVSNMVVVFVLLALIGLLYLTQITKTSNYSYEIDDLQNQYNEQLKINQSLKQDAARLKSLQRVADASSDHGLVDSKQDDVNYKN